MLAGVHVCVKWDVSPIPWEVTEKRQKNRLGEPVPEHRFR